MSETPAPANVVLVLNPNVLMAKAAAYPEDTRQRLGGNADDYVLSERRSRYSALRISADTARFVQRFSAPARLLDAVVAHSEEIGDDPFALLESVLPIVTQLQAQRILLPPSDVRPVSVEPRFRAGESLAGWRIAQCVEAQNETELYRVEHPVAGQGALKWVPADAPAFVRQALDREESILQLLEARGMASVPRVLDQGREDDGAFLVVSWCDGMNFHALLRQSAPPLATRVAMAERLVTLYDALHRHGVLHSDVHFGNLVGNAAGSVSIIDFGSARRLDQDDPDPRAGVLAEYEPEAVRELIEDRQPPPATLLGEQYCVAAMVFRLITLMPPVRLSLESTTALRQIADQPPRPFADAGIAWPALEAVLERALAKAPEDRFASTANFLAALRRALVHRPLDIEAQDRQAAPARRDALEALLRVYGPDSGLIDTGLGQGPTCSLYYGATGVAYALLRAAILEGSASALDGADAWIERAIADASAPDAYENPDVGIFKNEIGPTAVFHTSAGTHAVRAMVRHVSGDARGARHSVQSFLDVIASVDPSADRRFLIDSMNGPAGHLQAASLLFAVCRDLDAPLREQLSAAIDRLSAVVIGHVSRAREGRADGTPRYVGMAHGAAGALFALSQASAIRGCDLAAAAEPLDWLAAHARDVSGGLAWPVDAGPQSGAPWTGWCHGSAGHVILWSLVARLRGRQDDRDRAVGAAQHVWTNRRHGNPTLCCGLAGEALSLCAAARVSGDTIWHDRARALVEQAPSTFDPIAPHSLYRGHLGLLLAALEMRHPERAAFPLSEPIIPE